MTNIAAKFRTRRAQTRTRKAVNRAIDNAATTTVREELIAVANARRIRVR
jgi:hypothetical protein